MTTAPPTTRPDRKTPAWRCFADGCRTAGADQSAAHPEKAFAEHWRVEHQTRPGTDPRPIRNPAGTAAP